MNKGWKQRLHGEREPDYGESKLFTVELHHGGTFGEWGYYDETVDWFDFMEEDRFSLMELNKMVVGLLRKEDYMQYLWLPAGKDINNGLMPIYNDDDLRKVVKGRKEHKVVVYIKMLTEEEVDRIVNSHIESVQLEAEYNQIKSGVCIEELDESGPANPVVVTRKPVKKNSSILKLRWREDWIAPVNEKDHPVNETENPRLEAEHDRVEVEHPRAEEVSTPPPRDEPVSPTTNPWDYDSDCGSANSVDLEDSDLDVYDDNDVQERFKLDKMWQDSAARCSGHDDDADTQGGSASGSHGRQSEPMNLGNPEGEPELSTGGCSRSRKRRFITDPEPQEVDSVTALLCKVHKSSD